MKSLYIGCAIWCCILCATIIVGVSSVESQSIIGDTIRVAPNPDVQDGDIMFSMKYTNGGEVTVMADGTVKHEGYTPDEAAAVFWTAVGRKAPCAYAPYEVPSLTDSDQ